MQDQPTELRVLRAGEVEALHLQVGGGGGIGAERKGWGKRDNSAIIFIIIDYELLRQRTAKRTESS